MDSEVLEAIENEFPERHTKLEIVARVHVSLSR